MKKGAHLFYSILIKGLFTKGKKKDLSTALKWM